MTVELLRYANRAKIAEALTNQGYEVHRVTVNRWARGREMPRIAERMILALFGHDPDTTKEAAPPQWAERLETRIISEVRANREVLIEALAVGFAEQAARELDADSDDEGPHGIADQPLGGAGPKPRPAP